MINPEFLSIVELYQTYVAFLKQMEPKTIYYLYNEQQESQEIVFSQAQGLQPRSSDTWWESLSFFEAAHYIDIAYEARCDQEKGERKQISLGLKGVKVY